MKAFLGSRTLEYEITGDGEPVLTIHGALIADAFKPLTTQDALVSRYQLITYHRRGYAPSSEVSDPLSVEEQASDCLELLEFIGVGPAHVVGHSFGGVVALQLAIGAPRSVHSLVLLEPAIIVGASAAAYRESLENAIRLFHTRETKAAVTEMMRARWPEYERELEKVLPG